MKRGGRKRERGYCLSSTPLQQVDRGGVFSGVSGVSRAEFVNDPPVDELGPGHRYFDENTGILQTDGEVVNDRAVD